MAALTREHRAVVDCGTGNGQAAVGLTKHFQRVIATDPIGYGRPQAATTYVDEIRKITKAPIKYLISFVLPRFCEQTLDRSWKAELYGRVDPWVAKLDTIVHELYHIDPVRPGIRRMERADGTCSASRRAADCELVTTDASSAGNPRSRRWRATSLGRRLALFVT